MSADFKENIQQKNMAVTDVKVAYAKKTLQEWKNNELNTQCVLQQNQTEKAEQYTEYCEELALRLNFVSLTAEDLIIHADWISPQDLLEYDVEYLRETEDVTELIFEEHASDEFDEEYYEEVIQSDTIYV